MLPYDHGQASPNHGPQLFHLEYKVGVGSGMGPGKLTGSFGSDGQSVFYALVWGILGGTIRHSDSSERWIGPSTTELTPLASLVTVRPVLSGTRELNGPGWGYAPGWAGALGSGPPRELHSSMNDRMRDKSYAAPRPPSAASFNHLRQEFQIYRWFPLKLVQNVPLLFFLNMQYCKKCLKKTDPSFA